MVAEIDIWRAAKLLIDQRGESAGAHAMQRIIDMQGAGDEAGEAAWLKVFGCVRELLRKISTDGESRH